MPKENIETIKAALLKRAQGYEVEEKVIEVRRDGSQRIRIMHRHIPPDPKAAERVMMLMKSGRW